MTSWSVSPWSCVYLLLASLSQNTAKLLEQKKEQLSGSLGKLSKVPGTDVAWPERAPTRRGSSINVDCSKIAMT